MASIFVSLCNDVALASTEAEFHKRVALQPLESERAVRAPLDSLGLRVIPSSNETVVQKNSRPRSPSLSEESAKRREIETSGTSCKENNSGSGSDTSSTQGNNFLLSDATTRKHLYRALQKNEHDRAREVLMIMAFNKLSEPEKLKASYDILKELFPRFNKTVKENFPGYAGHCYVDILCSFAPWHSALMLVFFDELKRSILRPTPQVLRARYYAVKWLEVTIKRLVQEILSVMTTESPALLTPSVKAFLDAEFVEQTFEAFLYQEITQKISAGKSTASPGPGIYEASTPPMGIFEKLGNIESEGISPLKEDIHTTRD